MKTMVKNLSVGIFAVMLVFALTNCKEPGNSPDKEPDDIPAEPAKPADKPDSVINIAAILGVTAPEAGKTPVIEITESEQYGGTVAWTPADETFKNSTVYFAKITLVPIKGYILEGVAADFFTVAGANTVSNDADSGVITAVFPRTNGTADNPAVVDIKTIEGINAPVDGEIPKTAINPTSQYTGTVTWSPDDNQFISSITYTATVTLTPRAGFTFMGVTADFFTVKGADTASNDANSNVITAVFPKTAGPAIVDIKAIEGLTAPIVGGTPVTAINQMEQYTGTVTWSPSGNQV